MREAFQTQKTLSAKVLRYEKHGAFGRSEKFSVHREECSRGGVLGDQGE